MLEVIAAPKFCKGQQVRFVGGIGVIQTYHLEAGTWTYSVQLTADSKSQQNKVGSGPVVRLMEADIE